MTALYIIGGIVLFCILIGFVPVGAEAVYDARGFSLKIRAGFLSLSPGARKPPQKAKKEKPEKKKPEKEKPEKQKPEKKKAGLPPLPVLLILLKRGFAMLGRLLGSFRFELLKLHVTAASGDPADAAALYAAAGMGMDALLHIGQGRIEKSDLRAEVDFDAAEPRIELHIRLTVRIGSVFGAGLRFGLGFLKDYIGYKKGG